VADLLLGRDHRRCAYRRSLDRSTGASPVQHLYDVPIVAAGARFGMVGGLLAAFTAVLLYHWANPHLLAFRYEQLDLLQIAVLIAAGVLTAKLTDDARASTSWR
jgi:K+-sensing histidine kinase KdpD